MKGISKKIEEQAKKDSLKRSITEGSVNAVKLGFLENYINPFAIMLGAGNMGIAIVTSLPLFIGSVAQIFSAKIAEFFGSRRLVVSMGALMQALLILPLIILPVLFKEYAVLLVIIFYSLYLLVNYLISPVWDSWMSDIVNEEKRGRYFGKRNKIVGATNFFAMLIAGAMLSWISKINVIFGFSIIFFIAAIARIISSYLLKKVYEPAFFVRQTNKFSFMQFLSRMQETNYGRFVIYHGLMRFSVAIFSPFLPLFILRDVGFNYFEYMLIISAGLLTTFLTMLYWGKYADFFGNKKVITISAGIIVIIPLAYMFSQNLFYMMLMEALGGFAWAGHNLASTNFIFDAVKPENRIRAISYFNAIIGTMILLGSLAGGIIASAKPAVSIFKYDLFIVFFLSFVMRLGAALWHLPLIKEERKLITKVDTKLLFVDIIAVRPIHIIIKKTKTAVIKVKDYYNSYNNNHNNKKI